MIGEAPLVEELRAGWFAFSEDPDQIAAVVASFDHTFNYHKLQVAFNAIHAGARFFATNADCFCPVPGGGEPDSAAVIAAVETCASRPVEAVVGKPSIHTNNAILHRIQLPSKQCLITSDRLETGVEMGLAAGMAAALVLTGATAHNDLADASIQPSYLLQRLAELIP